MDAGIKPAPHAADDSTAHRAAPLALAPAEFRRAAHALVDAVADFLERVPQRPVTPAESPAAVRALLDASAPLPEQGLALEPLLASAENLLFDHSLFNGHPRFFGYVTSSPTPAGMLADFLAAAVNPNVGAWALSPMATEIEAQTVRWIAELVGYPADCDGLLVSGGNMANFTALLAALAAADPEARRSGRNRPGEPRLRVYASAETHTWLQKAVDLAGLGTDAVRWLPVDDQQRLDTSALRAALERDRAAGERPALVIGTAGTVSTGAIDPLVEISEICRAEGVWFHVDGAYGGFAAALPDAATDLRALALADSVALDPHKWLYAPLEAGCVLVRSRDALPGAFSYHPPYYHFGQEATNYFDRGPQNSRGFRALKVWLALRLAGRAGYQRMIADDVRLAATLFAELQHYDELEPATLNLSIATFRYVPTELRSRIGQQVTEAYLNRLNEALLDRIQKSGEAFVSNAVVGGRYLLRACIVNFNTDVADVKAVPPLAVRLGRELDAQLR